MLFSINFIQRISAKLRLDPSAGKSRRRESGFSLIEVIIALLVFLVVLLGVFVTFVYAVNYNAGNNARSQGLTVLQQQVELIRSGKFTPTKTDDSNPDLTGGIKAWKTTESEDKNRFKYQVIVDDDPFTDGVQIDNSTTIKEITVTVTLESPTPGWQTAVPSSVVLRRVRAN